VVGRVLGSWRCASTTRSWCLTRGSSSGRPRRRPVGATVMVVRATRRTASAASRSTWLGKHPLRVKGSQPSIATW